MSRLLEDAAGPRENVVRGTVKEIAYMGDVSIYLVQIDSGKTVRVTLPNIMRDAEHRITRDETVYLSWHGSSPVVLTE
jgi:putrescine transport system ATP-binding protein